ncbi:MAG: sulfotransferase [Bacteroidetes bacterium]|nr:sulfotransferase [Bacteroidota bacterium]
MVKLSPALRRFFGTYQELPAVVPKMPIFITGNMRSGTTLIVNKLAQHPQLLKVGSELNEIWTKIGGAPCLDICKYLGSSHADFTSAYNMTSYFFRYIQESKSLKRHAMRAVNKYKMQEGRICYDWDHIIPVNKSTHLTNKMGYVKALFPGAKFIFIIRDIFGHSSSMKYHLEDIYKRTGKVYLQPHAIEDCWSRSMLNDVEQNGLSYPGEFSTIPRMWIRLNKVALEDLENMSSKSYLLVDYNEFVINQKEQLQRIFNFLDLETKHKKEEKKISGSVTVYKNTSTTGDPLTKWQKLLSQEEQKIITKVIEENQSGYDYILERTKQLKY